MANVKVSELPPAGSLTGAEMVPVVQGGTTKRAAVSALAPSGPVNLVALGADPTGVAFSDAALEAAFDIIVAAGGGEVYARRGHYKFNANHTWPNNIGGVLRGEGDGTIFEFTGSGVFLTIAPTGFLSNVALRDLRGISSSSAATHWLKCVNAYHVLLDNIRGYSPSGTAFTTAFCELVSQAGQNCALVRLKNSVWQQGAGDGLRVTGGVAALTIDSSRIQGFAAWGVNAPGAAGVELAFEGKSVVEGNAAGQVYADSLFTTLLQGIHLECSSGDTDPAMVLGLNSACSIVVVSTCNFGGSGSNSYLLDLNGAGGQQGFVFDVNNFTDAVIAAVRMKAVLGARASLNVLTGVPTLFDHSSSPQSQGVLEQGRSYECHYSSGAWPQPQQGFGVRPSQLSNDRVTLDNAGFIASRNAAGTGHRRLFGLNASDEVEIGEDGAPPVFVRPPVEMIEQADPAAPAANRLRYYARDNGSGKTQLCVRFPTGAVQVIATEP